MSKIYTAFGNRDFLAKRKLSLLGLGLVFLITVQGVVGCASALAFPQGVATPFQREEQRAIERQATEGILPTSVPKSPIPFTNTMVAVPALTQTPRPNHPLQRKTILLTPTPTVLPTPETGDQFTANIICSPLRGVLRADLHRFIADPYRPPPMGSDDRHQGVDFSFYNWKTLGRIEGRAVQAVLPGQVTAALEDTYPFGTLVIVETPGERLPRMLQQTLGIPEGRSLYLLYAHLQLNSLRVKLGDEVRVCQQLGNVGRSGNTEAPHLHLEARHGPPGVRFMGFSAYVPKASPEERASYFLWRTSGQFLHFDPMLLLSYGITPYVSPTPRLPKGRRE